MKICIIGYGKMGKMVEKIAISKGHSINQIIDSPNDEVDGDADVAIIFSTPESAVINIMKCFEKKIPVICGTTGWLNDIEKIKNYCETNNSTFLFSPNFSLGVNLFFKINNSVSKIMRNSDEFDLRISEVHHTSKIDSPSGTALKIKKDIDSILNKDAQIASKRIGSNNGIHEVIYESFSDLIKISHTAKNRDSFALGSIVCAQWIISQNGFFEMDDFLNDFL
tara:strand:+ start:5316 stop:5984 length:669 start_codon:yes stop_codon:yes gene_type:complete